MEQPVPPPTLCPVCSGRMAVLARLATNEFGLPVTYLRCERCSQVVLMARNKPVGPWQPKRPAPGRYR